jgi:hypothetical protein
MALIYSAGGEKMIVTAINDDSLRVFKINKQFKNTGTGNKPFKK